MWVTKLLISPVKKRIFFAQKQPNLAQNWLFLCIAGSFGALLVGWLVVEARAVSRKTPIYFIVLLLVGVMKSLTFPSSITLDEREQLLFPTNLPPL